MRKAATQVPQYGILLVAALVKTGCFFQFKEKQNKNNAELSLM